MAMRPLDELRRQVAPLNVQADFAPSGDQPATIDELERRILGGEQDVVLLGATGTGKTATVAWLAERLQRPVLVMQPNKTLAAQFANELRQFFPDNAVEYFVSCVFCSPESALGYDCRCGAFRRNRRRD